MRFEIASHAASYRRASADRLAVLEVPGAVVLVIADGAGGLSGGAAAADQFVAFVDEALLDPAFSASDPSGWVELLHRADLVIARAPHAGETTAVVVALLADRLIGASCGDSGACIVTIDRLDDLTAAQQRKQRLGSGRAHPMAYERPALADGTLDGFDEAERAALHGALDEGHAAARAGDHADAEQFVKTLAARR